MPTPTNIKTGLNPEFPLSFAQAENGFLYGVNGIDAPLKWDGQDSATQDVGVTAPTQAPVLQGVTTTTLTTLVTSSGGLNPRSIQVDETNGFLYVTYENATWNRIKRYTLAGASGTDILLSANRPESLAIDVSNGLLYWTSHGGGGAGAGQLRRATLAGASNTLLVGSLTNPRGLALDVQNGHLYWVEGGLIKRSNLNGGDVVTVYSGATNGYAIAIDIANLHLYYGTTTGGFIARVNTDGTGGVNLASGLGNIVDIKLDLIDLKLYAADFTNGRIYRMNLDGSNFETLYSPAGAYGLAISRANSHLFFVDNTNSEVERGSLRNLAGTYTAYLRFIDGDGNPSALSPISNEATVAGASSFSYTSVQAAGAGIARRQILRNTDGQNLVYYVDIDTTDLSTTTFTSDQDDDELATGEAVALFDSDGQSLVSRFGLPPTDRMHLIEHSSRLFAAGTTSYEGTCTVSNGSASVTGSGTAFTTSMIGRRFKVKGQSGDYEISAVGGATALTLASNYTGTSGYFEFEISSPPATRNLVHFSEVGPYFDGWNPLKPVEVGDPNDDVTGLLSASSYLYVFQRRALHRLTYQDNPEDGTAFLEFRRGAVNQRCIAQVGGDTYVLDERGIYRFRGGEEDVSGPIQVLFRSRSVAPHLPRIAWVQARFFHAAVDLAEEVIRWFVCLGNTYFPRHALCYRFSAEEWWIEQYPYAVPASGSLFGVPAATAAGCSANRIQALVPGELDGLAHDDGTTRIRLSGATLLGVTFSPGVSLPASPVGVPVSVVSGRGVGQSRLIVAASAGSLTIDKPWAILPDATSQIQIGGIPWLWRSRQLTRADRSENQDIAVSFVPSSGSLDVRTYDDYARMPTPLAANYGEYFGNSDGVRTRAGAPEVEVDLSTSDGYALWRRGDANQEGVPTGGVFQVELRGVAARDPLRLRTLRAWGVEEVRANA
jgi:hypothetical protein